jgi:hypothetical protein
MASDAFPSDVLAVLRQTKYDVRAVRKYEHLSGGFFWSDEGLMEVFAACGPEGTSPMKWLVAYRTHVIRGEKPREDCARTWEQLEAACPSWPGFRPERREQSLLSELPRPSKKSAVRPA